MGIIQGFDANAFPDLAQATPLLDALGAGSYASSYIGGPGHSATNQPITPQLVRDYVGAGHPFLPIFVLQVKGFANPSADVDSCVALLEEFGFPSGSRVLLDLEPETGSDPAVAGSYGAAVVSGLQAAGYVPGMYAQIAQLMYVATVHAPYFVVFPSWFQAPGQGGIVQGIDPYHPTVSAPPLDAWNQPGQRGWQYAGNVTINGLLVDLDVIDSAIPNTSLTPLAAPVATLTDVEMASAQASQALALSQSLDARVTALENAAKGVASAEGTV